MNIKLILSILCLISLTLTSSQTVSGSPIHGEQTDTLDVQITNTTQYLPENSNYSMAFSVTTSNMTDVSLTFSVTLGEVDTTADVVPDVNGTEIYYIMWSIPSVDMNTTAELKVTATADGLSVSDTGTYTIYKVLKNMTVDVDFLPVIDQNQSLPITVTVTDMVSNNPVMGASVSFLLEVGTFEEETQPKDGSFQAETDNLGQVMATADFSAVSLLFDQYNGSISIMVEREDYQPVSAMHWVLIKAVEPVTTISIEHTSLTISEKGTVNFTVTLQRNNQPWSNASIEAVATGGAFANGEVLQRLSTNNIGQTVFVWSSAAFPDLVENQSITITFKVTTPGVDLADNVYTITVVAEGSTQVPFSTDVAGTPISLPWILLGFPLLRRRRK